MNREETLLLGIIVGTSSLMLLSSTRYAPDARLFPQAAASITIFFGVVTVVQSSIDIGTGDGMDIVSRVQESEVLAEEIGDKSGGNMSDNELDTQVGKAAEGEFRIKQPTIDYVVPFIGTHISQRIVVAFLLLVYFGTVWLLGIAISSMVFLVLYAWAVRLRWRVFVALMTFVVAVLVLFGVWLETPLFRPGHDAFSLLEVL